MYVMPGQWQQVVTHLALSCQAALSNRSRHIFYSFICQTECWQRFL